MTPLNIQESLFTNYLRIELRLGDLCLIVRKFDKDL